MISLLDESLEIDRERSGRLSNDLATRILDLARYAERAEADGILFTCSAFGAAVETANKALGIPVLKPNEAMFADALSHGERIAMIYTFPPAAAGMEVEFDTLVASQKGSARLTSVLCEGALNALKAGDQETHDHLIAECGEALQHYDAILLAQFSMAGAAPLLRARTETTVKTSPESAIHELRRRVDTAHQKGATCSSA